MTHTVEIKPIEGARNMDEDCPATTLAEQDRGDGVVLTVSASEHHTRTHEGEHMALGSHSGTGWWDR